MFIVGDHAYRYTIRGELIKKMYGGWIIVEVADDQIGVEEVGHGKR